MGAACGNLNCNTKKQIKYPKTIIRRPTPLDLSQEEDTEEQDERITLPPDNEEARIGVYFQVDELLYALKDKQKAKAVSKSRLEKWFKMVTYGLEEQLIPKVIIKRNKTPYDPIIFSKYARVGLNNFYEAYPELFMDRLAKGPPPQYRWLAWK